MLRGPTGCGKTTKVPQFILDDYKERNLFCNIVVAQPRRIAASSNAKRVCNERGWTCGSIVGYQVPICFRFFHFELDFISIEFEFQIFLFSLKR